MVSFLRYLCTDQHSQQEQYKEHNDRLQQRGVQQRYSDDGLAAVSSMELNRQMSDDYAGSADDQFSARSTPSAHRITFQSMLMDIQNSRGGDLAVWTVKKMHQYTCYLSDRLRKSKAFRGYFLIICRLVDLFKQHLQMMVQEGQELPKQVDKEALIMTLMCVQALNKVYGRRSDVRASCHLLVEKVATDFSAVTQSLKDGLKLVNPSLQISVADFIVPRDSRILIAELKREIKLKGDLKNADAEQINHFKQGLVRILSSHRIRISDFTQGDIIWLEREVQQYINTNNINNISNNNNTFNQDQISLVYAWLLHIVQPLVYSQPKF
eukprot:TRINITY_DN3915_c1_g1_i14.p1 TRINITY_DN3915_c1_g1~~TRINITY_DN3915_c1_g1_i14.p1  ORF type:complete len:324 (-),score=41.18 TRINITY_DN3915_c1_g1_i14:1066-2037(-)